MVTFIPSGRCRDRVRTPFEPIDACDPDARRTESER
jgi:hypothetical protein